ncbi:MAG: flagellin FliC [candidate division Zixibacteria bacterium]|nr:flagellin FliC [candidate division Zixibacteria bacterium]
MGLGIKNNLLAVNLNRNINQTLFNHGKSMEKLSSGWKINSAADDPAALVISEQMRTRIASLNQEIENVSYQISKYKTTDSALLQERSKLTELRTLAVAAANDGGIDDSARAAYQAEADNIVNSFNMIRESSEFGTQKLLDGSEGSIADVNELISVDLSDSEAAEASMNQIDDEIAHLDAQIADVGATQKNSLESRLTNLRIESQNLTAAESQIRDTDYTAEYSNFVKNQMLLKSTLSLFSHTSISSSSVLSLLSGTK